MPIDLKLVGIKNVLNNVPEPDRVIVNDLPIETKDDLEILERMMLSTYSDNDVDFIAACSCGEKKGNYLIGTKCVACGTEVTDPWELPEPRLFIRKLQDDLPFMVPHFWGILTNILRKNNYDVLAWMTNSRARPPARAVPALNHIETKIPGFNRNYKWFIENFRWVLPAILALPCYNTSSARPKINDFLTLLKTTKDEHIFADYLPIPHKRLLVVESTSKGRYMDYNIGYIKDAANAAAMAKLTAHNEKARANKTSFIVTSINKYYVGYYQKFWRRKTGVPRRHLFSTRSYFSFRGVITQINEPHMYDELHIPWGIGLTVLRPHIINKLLKRGMTLTNATKLLYECIYRWDPVLDEIMRELIAESNFVTNSGTCGIPCLICRNPTMKQGSIQRLAITKVKNDVADNTISFSIHIAKSKNADFDGDEENVILALDKRLADMLEPLSPSHNAIGSSDVLGVSGFLFLPKPTVATLANWIESVEEETLMSEQEVENLAKLGGVG